MSPNTYERQQIAAIRAWKMEEPPVASSAVNRLLAPVTWLIQKSVPEAAVRRVLDLSSSAAQWLTDTNDVVRDAGVKNVAALRKHDLEQSDRLANDVHNWAIGMASVEGGVTGAAGVIGMAIDFPSMIVIALRTIHKAGVCYGFEVSTQGDRDFVLAILAVASANDMAQKVAALAALRSTDVSIGRRNWKKLARNAATQPAARAAGIIATKNLARVLRINLAKRKVLQALPLVGAVVGASVNAWYLKEVGWAARRAFQERWLIENHKLVEA